MFAVIFNNMAASKCFNIIHACPKLWNCGNLVFARVRWRDFFFFVRKALSLFAWLMLCLCRILVRRLRKLLARWKFAYYLHAPPFVSIHFFVAPFCLVLVLTLALRFQNFTFVCCQTNASSSTTKYNRLDETLSFTRLLPSPKSCKTKHAQESTLNDWTNEWWWKRERKFILSADNIAECVEKL